MKNEIVSELEEIDSMASSYIETIIDELGQMISDRIHKEVVTAFGIQEVDDSGVAKPNEQVFEEICDAYEKLSDAKKQSLKEKLTNFETKITKTKNTIRIKFD